MRYVSAVFLLLALPVSAQTRKQSVSGTVLGSASSAQPSAALAALTPGSTLIAFLTDRCGATPTISDPAGHAWQTAVSFAGPTGTAAIFFAPNSASSAGDLPVIKFAASCNNPAIRVDEWTGLAGTLDGAPVHAASPAGGINQTPQPISAGNLVTTQAGDLLVAAFADNCGAGPSCGPIAGAGWTMTTFANASVPGGTETQIAGAPGSYAANGTIPQALFLWTGAAAAFKPAGGAPPPPPRQVPVAFSLTDANGNAITGTITLYSDVINADQTVTKTPVANWTLSGGKANAFVVAAPTGWYEYDLAGPIATVQAFMPGVFAQLLASANSISITATLDPVTGQPVRPYSFGVQ